MWFHFPKSNEVMSNGNGVKIHERLVVDPAQYFLGCLPSLRFLWLPFTVVITLACRQPLQIMEICLYTVTHKLLGENVGTHTTTCAFFIHIESFRLALSFCWEWCYKALCTICSMWSKVFMAAAVRSIMKWCSALELVQL